MNSPPYPGTRGENLVLKVLEAKDAMERAFDQLEELPDSPEMHYIWKQLIRCYQALCTAADTITDIRND